MSLLLGLLAFLVLVTFGAIQVWLGARLVKAPRQGWDSAFKVALYCVLLSFPVHLLFGQSPASSVVNLLIGTAVIRRVLDTPWWRALPLSIGLQLVSFAIAFAITGTGQLNFEAG